MIRTFPGNYRSALLLAVALIGMLAAAESGDHGAATMIPSTITAANPVNPQFAP